MGEAQNPAELPDQAHQFASVVAVLLFLNPSSPQFQLAIARSRTLSHQKRALPGILFCATRLPRGILPPEQAPVVRGQVDGPIQVETEKRPLLPPAWRRYTHQRPSSSPRRTTPLLPITAGLLKTHISQPGRSLLKITRPRRSQHREGQVDGNHQSLALPLQNDEI